ncbi:UDP-N-acetylmuramate dehydrogenase [Maritimibacter harenae]|uniref:hypothetical protein n=1 Tax=Maritimibacter harenae TaxID=2606218 RepID=UPI0019279B86|nr:hypothetical protein [Maritimibacter harenae]
MAWTPVTTYAGLEDLARAQDPAEGRYRVLALRAAKLPDWREQGNAGSFFMNAIVPVAPEFADLPGHSVPGGRKLSAA